MSISSDDKTKFMACYDERQELNKKWSKYSDRVRQISDSVRKELWQGKHRDCFRNREFDFPTGKALRAAIANRELPQPCREQFRDLQEEFEALQEECKQFAAQDLALEEKLKAMIGIKSAEFTKAADERRNQVIAILRKVLPAYCIYTYGENKLDEVIKNMPRVVALAFWAKYPAGVAKDLAAQFRAIESNMAKLEEAKTADLSLG